VQDGLRREERTQRRLEVTDKVIKKLLTSFQRTWTHDICCSPSVCRLSVCLFVCLSYICNARAPYSGRLSVEIFGTVAIPWHPQKITEELYTSRGVVNIAILDLSKYISETVQDRRWSSS